LKTLAVIVNYKRADMTLRAIKSVLNSEALGSVEIVVMENSEDEDEAEKLRRELPSPVRLEINPENTGYGRACNAALEGFGGEGILLVNPDARLLPGCLAQLQKTLFCREKRAAVSPQIYWDEGLTFYLPPSYPPALFEFQSLLNPLDSEASVNRILSCLWRRHAVKIWRSSVPVNVNNLSGGLVLLKRQAVQKAGGLFDPRFFLYFEDTDLFIRLRKAGFSLTIDPKARAIHLYDQCGIDDMEKKRAHMRESLSIFLEKHGNDWAKFTKKCLEKLLPSGGPHKRSPDHVKAFSAPFTLNIPASLRNGWLFEWSPNANFIPSAARFGRGSTLTFHERFWDQLAPGRYFGRLGSDSGLETDFVRILWTVGHGNRLRHGSPTPHTAH